MPYIKHLIGVNDTFKKVQSWNHKSLVREMPYWGITRLSLLFYPRKIINKLTLEKKNHCQSDKYTKRKGGKDNGE